MVPAIQHGGCKVHSPSTGLWSCRHASCALGTARVGGDAREELWEAIRKSVFLSVTDPSSHTVKVSDEPIRLTFGLVKLLR